MDAIIFLVMMLAGKKCVEVTGAKQIDFLSDFSFEFVFETFVSYLC
jgi:hypothetical protein